MSMLSKILITVHFTVIEGTRSIMSQKKRPDKPYPEFPLYAHSGGRWAKVINYKTHYFGTWNDPKGALKEYLTALPYIKSGLTPPVGGDGYNLGCLCSEFYDFQKERFRQKEIGARHLKDIDDHNKYLLSVFGTQRNVESFTPADFAVLRQKIAKKYKLNRTSNYITKTRTIFRWAHKAGKIKTSIDFGLHFEIPSKPAKRRERQEKPKKLFSSDECRSLLEKASVQMKAMILLGLNGGFGQTDIGMLQFRHVDLARQWIDFPRNKTSVEREVPLWDETCAAIEAAIEHRPKKGANHPELVFVTRYGHPWVRCEIDEAIVDSVTREFSKLKQETNIVARGNGFYTLRHTFRTIADECKDQPAALRIMGHSDQSISEVYRENISPERLIAVTDHVRRWLFGGK